MYVVLGATGHVGSTVASSLLARGEAVTVVTRSAMKAAAWQQRGARAAVLDLGDAAALREVLSPGDRLFALNPPADPTDASVDTDAEERRTADAIASAVDGAGLERVVAQSTYGAQPGERIGDLGTLHHFEERLRSLDTPVAVDRGAYFFSNWDGVLPAVRDHGQLPVMLDPDTPLPMVAPADLGAAAVERLTAAEPHTGVTHVEGPRRYSPCEVAAVFAAALGRPVEVAFTPREQWVSTFLGLGFSPEAAESYAGLTGAAGQAHDSIPGDVVRGATTLEDYVAGLVAA